MESKFVVVTPCSPFSVLRDRRCLGSIFLRRMVENKLDHSACWDAVARHRGCAAIDFPNDELRPVLDLDENLGKVQTDHSQKKDHQSPQKPDRDDDRLEAQHHAIGVEHLANYDLRSKESR